jgi:probable selenium-dependent hydroxylase accessory protein YqeC
MRLLMSATAFLELLGLKLGASVALMGAGGKHTLMARLKQELTAAGMPVLLTSSTNLHRLTGIRESELYLVGQHPNWSVEVTERLRQCQTVYLLEQDLGQGMLKGLEPELLIRLRRKHPQAVMVIKTDGARKRAFKAPGPNEPVIPPFCDICVLIAGLDCIGRPLDERYVHRPEIVARLAEVESDTPMTPEIVARVVAHPRAYLPRFPPGAKRVLYLSKARPEQDRHQAREVFSRVPPGLFSLLAAGDTLSGRVEVYPQPDQ